MKNTSCLLLIAALHAPLLALPAKAVPPDDTLVGINYFAGWWEDLPNKWHGHGWTAQEPDWRKRFPERVPLLGCYNDQPTMDREIVAAAEHGVDFFSILWYFAPAGGKHTGDVARTNRGLDNFLSSTNAARMKFMVEYCNHADFTATYMDIPPVAVREQEHPYALLAAEAREARARHATDPIPWMPYLAAGWNPRPWTHPEAGENHRRFFTFPTRAEWSAELRQLREDFTRFPTLGLALPGGRRQKIFTIYAWNEFGEGGIMAPTRGEGTMKLDCLKEIR